MDVENNMLDKDMKKMVTKHGHERVRAWVLRNCGASTFAARSKPKEKRKPEELQEGESVSINTKATPEQTKPKTSKPVYDGQGWLARLLQNQE